MLEPPLFLLLPLCYSLQHIVERLLEALMEDDEGKRDVEEMLVAFSVAVGGSTESLAKALVKVVASSDETGRTMKKEELVKLVGESDVTVC
jgi:hypothetical protein